jgi:DNA-binding protein HU-beta
MDEKINYDDFVEQISQESGYESDTVREYLSGMFETVVTETTKGKKVKLRGFGSFQPRWYKAKRGINPQTGQPLDILPHYHIHFASSKILDDKVNNKIPWPFIVRVLLASLVVLLIALLIFFSTSGDRAAKNKQEKEPQTVVTKDNKAVAPVVEELGHEPVQKKVEHIKEPEVAEEPKVIEEPESKVIHEPKPQETVVVKKKKNKLLYPGSYRVTQNESLSTIGSKIYGLKGYWPLLFSANSSKILNPDLILKGDTLVVPDKTGFKKLYTPYMDVHKAYKDYGEIKKSSWILCQGSNFLGADFNVYLKKKLTPSEYKIINRCKP